MMNKTEFIDQYGPWAIVAGAAAGIGEAWAIQLAQKGLNLVLIALEEEALQQLSHQLQSEYGVKARTLCADLADSDTAQQLQSLCHDIDIGLLVYNACYSVIGEYAALPSEHKQRMIAVNCASPLRLIDGVLPQMIKRQRGGIILMSSLSGLQGTAMVGTYAASKAFTTNLGEALWYELAPQNIDVLTVMAGATATPTFLQLTPASKQAKVFPLSPEQVAKEGLAALGKQAVKIPGRINRIVYFITRHLMTRKMAVRFISRQTSDVYQ